jgi:mevalonate kinase
MRVNPLAGAGVGGHQIGVAKKDEQRDERLAAALRENLRRRKAQARLTRRQEPEEPTD